MTCGPQKEPLAKRRNLPDMKSGAPATTCFPNSSMVSLEPHPIPEIVKRTNHAPSTMNRPGNSIRMSIQKTVRFASVVLGWFGMLAATPQGSATTPQTRTASTAVEQLELQIPRSAIRALPMKNGIMVEFAVHRSGSWPIPAQVTLELTDLEGYAFAAESQQAMIQDPVQRLAVPLHAVQSGSPLSLFAIQITVRALTVSTTERINLFEILDRPRLEIYAAASTEGVCTALLSLRTVRSSSPLSGVPINWQIHDREGGQIRLQGTVSTSELGFAKLHLPLHAWRQGGRIELSCETATHLGRLSATCTIPSPSEPPRLQAIAWSRTNAHGPHGLLAVHPAGFPPEMMSPIVVQQEGAPPRTLEPRPVTHPAQNWSWAHDDAIIDATPQAVPPGKAAAVRVWSADTPDGSTTCTFPTLEFGTTWLAVPEMGTLVPKIENRVFLLALDPGASHADTEWTWSLGGLSGAALTQGDGIAVISILTAEKQPVLRIMSGPPAPAVEDIPLLRSAENSILVSSDQYWYASGDRLQAGIWTPTGCAWVMTMAESAAGHRDLQLLPIRNGVGDWQWSPPTHVAPGPVRLHVWAWGADAEWHTGTCIWFSRPSPERLQTPEQPPEGSSVLTWTPEQSAPGMANAIALGLDLGLFELPGHPFLEPFASLCARLFGAGPPSESALALLRGALLAAEATQPVCTPAPPVVYDSLREETIAYARAVADQVEEDLQILAFAETFNQDSGLEEDQHGIDPWGERYNLDPEATEPSARWGDHSWAKANQWELIGIFAARTGNDRDRMALDPTLREILRQPPTAATADTPSSADAAHFALVVPSRSAEVVPYSMSSNQEGEEGLLLTPDQGVYPLRLSPITRHAE